jgi:benzoylformate decarboxylase
MKMTGAEILLSCLENEGVKYIFGNPGTTEVAILDALVEKPELEYILTLHESIAVGMADGYARAGGGVGFVNVHTALGLSNAIGNLYSAHIDGTPLVLTIANKDSRILGRGVFSEVDDITGMTRQFTKWSWQILRSDRVAENINKAFKVATTPATGPVFLSIPEDFLAQQMEAQIPPSRRFKQSPRMCPHPEDIQKAVALLLHAQKPVMIVGNDVAKTEALTQAIELAELLGIPVLTEGRQSLSFMNFPSKHPLYRGSFDPHSTYIQDCDLILGAGCELFVQTSYSEKDDILNTIKTVHLHSNPAKLSKLYPVELPIITDVKEGLIALTDLARTLITPAQTDLFNKRSQQLKTEWDAIESAKTEQIQANWGKSPIKLEQLVKEINDAADSDAIIVDEGIRSSRPLLKYYNFSQPGSYYRSPAGYLGWGLPAALGIKLALTQRQVIAYVGDGAYLMSNQGLWTAARYNIPVNIIVCNNRLYKAVRDSAVRFNGKAVEKNHFIGSSIDDPAPNLAKIAEGFGVPAFTISEPGEIKPTLEKALNSGGPSVIEVIIDK